MPHSTDSHASSLSTLSFEDALGELEQIVRDLESGKMTLENALKAYERGAKLRNHCEARLGEAEMRVKAIVQKADGSLTETPLEEESSATSPKKRSPKARPSSTTSSSNDDLEDNVPF